MELNDCLYVPQVGRNLISVSYSSGYFVLFENRTWFNSYANVVGCDKPLRRNLDKDNPTYL